MKATKFMTAIMMVATMAFIGCSNNNPPENPNTGGTEQGGEGGENGGGEVEPGNDNLDIPANAITVAKAREIAGALASEAETDEAYYIVGYVKKIHNKHSEGVTKYGNGQFYIEDVKGANSQDDFLAYQVYGLNGQKLTSEDQVEVGDHLVIYGKLTNYNGTLETVGKGQAYIYSSTNPKLSAGGSGEGGNQNTGEVLGSESAPLSVSEAIAKNSPNNPAYVKGYIVGFVDGKSLADGAKLSADGAVATNILIAESASESDVNNAMPVQLPVGAIRSALNLADNAANLGKEVVLYGTLEKYFGTAGLKSVTYAVLDGKKIGDAPGTAESEGGAVTIAEFLKAAESNMVWYELTGEITDEGCDGDKLKFEMEQYGDFMLKDATGSVYVYGIAAAKGGKFDKSMGLQKGQTITLKGLRSSFGGNPQVKSAYLVK